MDVAIWLTIHHQLLWWSTGRDSTVFLEASWTSIRWKSVQNIGLRLEPEVTQIFIYALECSLMTTRPTLWTTNISSVMKLLSSLMIPWEVSGCSIIISTAQATNTSPAIFIINSENSLLRTFHWFVWLVSMKMYS